MKLYLFFVSVFLFFLNNEINGQLITNNKIYVLDGHSHHGFPKITENDIDSDITYLSNLGYNAIVFLLPQDRKTTNELLVEDIDNDIKKIKQLSIKRNTFRVLNLANELQDNYSADKMSFMFAIEYFNGVFNDLSVIKKYKNLGIEYITLINNKSDKLFSQLNGKPRLTDLGKNVIKKMNEFDVKIDISHLNESEMLEVIKYSIAPVIASHSNTKKVSNLDYNLSNKVLNALNKNQGLVLLSFNTNGLYPKNNKSKDAIKQFADHIDHLKLLIGINLIGIGTDLQAYGKYVPPKLSKKETFEVIIDELFNRKYTKKEIELIFFKNYMNFMK